MTEQASTDAPRGARLSHFEAMRRLGLGLDEYLLMIEKEMYRDALGEAEGVLGRAAELLGLKYQTMAAALTPPKGRHRNLAHLRKEVVPRKRSGRRPDRRRKEHRR